VIKENPKGLENGTKGNKERGIREKPFLGNNEKQ